MAANDIASKSGRFRTYDGEHPYYGFYLLSVRYLLLNVFQIRSRFSSIPNPYDSASFYFRIDVVAQKFGSLIPDMANRLSEFPGSISTKKRHVPGRRCFSSRFRGGCRSKSNCGRDTSRDAGQMIGSDISQILYSINIFPILYISDSLSMDFHYLVRTKHNPNILKFRINMAIII